MKKFKYTITNTESDIIASGEIGHRKQAIETAIKLLPSEYKFKTNIFNLKVTYFSKNILFQDIYHELKYIIWSDGDWTLLSHYLYKTKGDNYGN